MNFTREPIIETIITPRDGCRLAVRNSKGVGHEEYFVDALEVVSYGNAYFYRSIERSKSFLLPITDFEVVELKESRMNLKHATVEKNVKIGGGRDAAMRPKEEEPSEESAKSEDTKSEKKKESGRRRTKRRRSTRSSKDKAESTDVGAESAEAKEPSEAIDKPEPKKRPEPKDKPEKLTEEQSTLRSLLLVPPDSLISESLGLQKEAAKKQDKAEVIELKPEGDE